MKYPTYPTRAEYPSGLTDAQDKWIDDIAATLPNDAVDTLVALVRSGPLYDGDVPSKKGRDELLELNLCSKIIVSGKAMPQACRPYFKPPEILDEEDHIKRYSWGYQSASYLGGYVYKALLKSGRVKP